MTRDVFRSLLQEIFSWEIDGNRKKILYYKSNLIPRYFESLECYKKNFEPLLLGEIQEQIKNALFVKNNLNTSAKRGKLKNQFVNKKGTFGIYVRLDQKLKWTPEKFLVIVIFILGKREIISFGVLPEFYGEKKSIIIQIGLDRSRFFLIKKKITLYFLNQIFTFYSYVKQYNSINYLERMPSFLKNTILMCIREKTAYFTKNIDLYNYHLKKHFNQSQVNAIISILNEKICLIQGPPGTGKTRTIIGIISILNKYTKFNSKNNFSSFSVFRKLIICAASNTAVDENVLRSFSGFFFQKIKDVSKLYGITRLGPNHHFAIDHISFDNLVFMHVSEYSMWIKFWKNKNLIRKSQLHIWQVVKIIYTTLTCSSYAIFENSKFDGVFVIDEAAQAIEVDILPSLKNAHKIIMIGDIQQLPATIFSKYSLIFEYNRSLFKRFQLQKYPVWFLKTQYRMHSQISSFPARKFYKNGLKDSENVVCVKNFHSLRCFGPLVFFDIRGAIEINHIGKKFFWCNLEESRICKLLLELLFCLYPNIDLHSIAFVSGYNGQVKEIQKYVSNKKIDITQQVDTVDSFQGKEKAVIFFSCVRSKFHRGVGFLSDGRRINVAFTRAKNSFWCIGNAVTLAKNSNWKEFILDTQRRHKFFSIKKPFERSSRRLIYWCIEDNEDYFFDGEINQTNLCNLFVYLKKILKILVLNIK